MLDHALAAAKAAVQQAGEAILTYYRSQYEVRDKADDHPVTTADVAANRLLRQALTRAVPQAAWLSEESADDPARLHHDWVWIVDPLDGTKEFIQGIDEFVVTVALVFRHQPVVAATYNPVRRELFTACRGAGAFCNGTPLRVSTTARLQDAVVLASRSETRRGEFDRFAGAFTLRPVGSVAYKLALVAQGQGDLTFSLVPKNEWDICAGTLLVCEAGGRVSDPHGRPLRFNQRTTLRPGIVATNGVLHAEVLRLLRAHVGAEG
ncbi:MAG: hypothetical protein KatS3mg131_1817 [Candidatus Tectimicrobiota bacterium]|nr:MAG: hypothetical protein KatS3mg131_1817 [Candidatus Tectomicrobia bacterium]